MTTTTAVEVPEGQAEAVEPAAEQAVLPALCTSYSVAGARAVNQDVAIVGVVHVQNVKLTYVVVADGMGGYEGGETAARLAAGTFVSNLIEDAVETASGGAVPDMPILASAAVYAANEAVMVRAAENANLQAMGTTLTAAVLDGNSLYVASVGDSRCYLYRNETASALTRDDSFVRMLVDQGLLTSEEAENHPRANEITRALGSPEDLDELVVSHHVLVPGDLVLVCSDGLWKGGEADILEACSLLTSLAFTSSNLEETAKLLVEQALARGSDDNISVALLWVENRTDSTVSRPLNTEPGANSPKEE